MNRKVIATCLIAATALLMPGASLLAQQEMRVPGPIPGPIQPCPRPVHNVIHGQAQAPAPDPAAFGTLYSAVTGSQWNQTATDKGFGTTFRFPAKPKECCLMTKGTLVVTLRALQGGGLNSASSWNDDIVVFNGANKFYNQRIWPQGSAVATGQTITLTIPIPSNVLSTGFFNLYVEDDTAVVSADLTLDGCCV